nr:4-hydroxybenzoate octaprenyltransferase [Pseudolysobacter antarcticus]
MSDQPPLKPRPRAAVKSPEAAKPRIASTKAPPRASVKTATPKPRGNPVPTTNENAVLARLAAFASMLLAWLGSVWRALAQRWNALDWAHLRERLTQYAKLARLHKPIGAALLLWPTWWALWLAAGDFPPWSALIIFTLGVFLMRSAGCVINDYADRNLDPEVKRTMDRPIASGKVTPREALYVFAVLITLAFVLVLFTNTLTIELSLVGAALAASYPFMKRFTNLPQVYLGAAFGWSVPMAFGAVGGSLPPVCWLLFLANVVWSTIYDTQYAMVDRDDDIRVGAKSTAILFGDADRAILGILMVTFLGSMLMVGARGHLHWPYYAAMGVAVGLFVYQQWLTRTRERDVCFAAFRNNNWVGLVLFVGIAMSFAIR